MISIASYKLGIKNMLPIMPSVMLFGIILGISGSVGNVSFVTLASTSFIIFAGSAQFIVIALIIKNEPLLGIIIAGIVINLRHLMYSAVMHDLVKKTKFVKKLVISYLLTDEAFLITDLTYKQKRKEFDSRVYNVEDVFIASGLTLWILWNISTDVAFYITELIKNQYFISSDFIDTDFIVAATFLGYFVMNWNSSHDNKVLISIMSVIAVILAFYFINSTLIILILLIGILLGSLHKNFKSRIQPNQPEVTID